MRQLEHAREISLEQQVLELQNQLRAQRHYAPPPPSHPQIRPGTKALLWMVGIVIGGIVVLAGISAWVEVSQLEAQQQIEMFRSMAAMSGHQAETDPSGIVGWTVALTVGGVLMVVAIAKGW
jgi:hypothetical protein